MEKGMKKYMNRVRRHLNLPRDMKERVLSDFSSSIAARREAGMTDDAIIGELGSPKQAAADLNEQMKEFTYRKSPWRFLFGACAIYGGVKLLGALWVQILYWFFRISAQLSTGEAASIGIIGGADGPTAIFITATPAVHYLVPAVLLVVGVLGFLRLCKCKQKSK